MKQHTIRLSARERKKLWALTKRGSQNARVIKRAQILLNIHAGKKDSQIAQEVEGTVRTVERVRKKYCAEGLDRALRDAPRPGATPALNEKQEPHPVALACSHPPEEHVRWTVELLKDRLITEGVVKTVSVGTIHARLTERGIKPWRKNMWCVPKIDEVFLARMEDVLDLYALPYDPRNPLPLLR